MHHKNFKHSSANHNNPQHVKPKYPTGPAPEKTKSSFLAKLRGKFQEKPATESEIKQLRLNAQREVYKTQMAVAKSKRPSRFNGLGISEQPSRGHRRDQQEPSFLFGSSKSEGGFLDTSKTPSLSFITGQSEKKPKGYKSGLEELF